ncbi:MAG: 30S ribosomal protein S3 [Chloroflexi bacterium]|nr:30S ribosomal protein S3 [Chloroflexota bacterium]MBI3763945.1 30S ribosomal protein S3 [Chloroflexota bacterium]
MGRKVHPIGFRLKINKDWEARWFAEGRKYTDNLHQDFVIRRIILGENDKASVSRVDIERFPNLVAVNIWTAKPGIVIGRKGAQVKVLRTKLEELVGSKVKVDVSEITAPDLDARLVAENIAGQLERRIGHSRAMKRAIGQAMRAGAKGIKIVCAGRLAGSEMARREWQREGRVPLQTLRADIDFARAEALTTFGRIGVKVWIYKGDVLPEAAPEPQDVYVSE